MKTTILITEEQKRKLIVESLNNEIEDDVKQSYNLFKRITEFSKDEFSNNLGFLITWGAGIGGFMKPVNDFLSGEYPELSDRDTTLILLGIVGTIFMDNRTFIGDIIDKIKEKGLFDVFKIALNKSKNLKKTFISFLKSIDINVGSMVTMLSYAFMIPSLGPIINLVQTGQVTYDDTMLFVSSIGMSKLITLSGKVLSEFFKKLISKLQN